MTTKVRPRPHTPPRPTILRAAVALGGTISAEHGIGLLKVAFLAETVDPVALELARALKRTFDPRGILNPGKLLP